MIVLCEQVFRDDTVRWSDDCEQAFGDDAVRWSDECEQVFRDDAVKWLYCVNRPLGMMLLDGCTMWTGL